MDIHTRKDISAPLVDDKKPWISNETISFTFYTTPRSLLVHCVIGGVVGGILGFIANRYFFPK